VYEKTAVMSEMGLACLVPDMTAVWLAIGCVAASCFVCLSNGSFPSWSIGLYCKTIISAASIKTIGGYGTDMETGGDIPWAWCKMCINMHAVTGRLSSQASILTETGRSSDLSPSFRRPSRTGCPVARYAGDYALAATGTHSSGTVRDSHPVPF